MPRLSKIGAACLSAFGFGTGSAQAVTANYLVVAGGGGGGANNGGGGGAGGYLTGTTSLNLTQSYTIIVGAGGPSASAQSGSGAIGSNGANSSAFTLTAIGGGGGGGPNQGAGQAGGSGGGGGNANSGTAAGGAGTSGQGNNGATTSTSGVASPASGGGGAGAAGSAGGGNNGGNGGVGLASSISGTSTYYAGGGGGAVVSGYTAGTGGNGGGGAGAVGGVGTNGSANTGGGQGGCAQSNGGAGGSGVVIISYAGAQKFGGGIVSTDGTNTIHTFKTSGQLVPMTPVSADYLIVAGGGGGWSRGNRGGGGGGAGGMLTGSALSIDTSSTYIITVGAGGAQANSGSNSSISLVSTTAIGGGAGASSSAGANGGSGGGGDGTGGAGGLGTSGQGNNGGSGTSGGPYTYFAGGGGGGAGAAGANGAPNTVGGAGGNGIQSSITGTATYYAGGGGGGSGAYDGSNGPGNSTGGSGGGGYGVGALGANGGNGTTNTGGGGGGANTGTGGTGGSGIVVIRYAGTTQLMAGGTVTIVGGYVIHTFTSSGYLTPLTFIGRSLRFRSSASAYLSRTPSVAGSQQKFTWSGWVKRGALNNASQILFSANPSGSTDTTRLLFFFNTSNQLEVDGAANVFRATNALFRDPAAWYHIVLSVDTTQADATNRMLIYVNGVSQSFATNYSITQNTSLAVNYPYPHYHSYYNGSSLFFDGYMADVRFIDGQALTPNSFGTFNSYGVWQPINYGGSYGTNGFYLPMSIDSANTYSAAFNASSQYLTVTSPSSSLINWYSSNYTLEYWIHPVNFSQSSNSDSTVIGNFDPASTSDYWSFGPITGGYVKFYYWNGSQQSITTTKQLTANTWNHLALVNNGGVITIYINGVASGSASIVGTPQSSSSLPLSIGRNANTYFSGYLSNLRIVNSAVYTSNFVPASQPLTAITGTSFLTLQNSTIVDGSSNAYTINNFGSMTTTMTCPYIFNAGFDKSPAGNDWTLNNFGPQLTTNIDSMTDVPTLTSATAANYCVLNILQNGMSVNGSLSEGNLKFSCTGGDNRLGGTLAVSSGSWYYEVNIIGVGTGTHSIGFSRATSERTSNYQNLYWNGYFWEGDGYKQIIVNGVDSSVAGSAPTYTTGDVIGIAFDATNGTMTAYKNGVSTVTWTGITTGVAYIPSFYVNNGASMAVNFGQRPFAYTPPTGYVALNTYNL